MSGQPTATSPNGDAAGFPREAESGKTGMAAATYTLVAGAQKASGFLILIAFTRMLSPSEFGQVALLTTVNGLLLMVMTLGLEPRIMHAYFRAEHGLAAYLRTAERVSIVVPALSAGALSAVVLLMPLSDPIMWIMECVGSCLFAAGTTYAYAVLRSARTSKRYAFLAVGLLAVQVLGRVGLVALLDLGPRGWAMADLVSGVLAVLVGPLGVRALRPDGEAGPRRQSWQILREGMPLVPHYLAQWGLALSDRLILSIFVSTAAVGVYSALYQFAAVISMMLSEANRAFMPSYAKNRPGSAKITALLLSHLRITFIAFGIMYVGGFVAMSVFLPEDYTRHAELFPLLSFGSLVYGLYFMPMNALTLTAGRAEQAPVISVTALLVNVAGNFALDPFIGMWGAAVSTALGYATLTGLAALLATRPAALDWRCLGWGQTRFGAAYLLMGVLTICATRSGTLRLFSLAGVALLVVFLGVGLLAPRRGAGRYPSGGDGPDTASELRNLTAAERPAKAGSRVF